MSRPHGAAVSEGSSHNLSMDLTSAQQRVESFLQTLELYISSGETSFVLLYCESASLSLSLSFNSTTVNPPHNIIIHLTTAIHSLQPHVFFSLNMAVHFLTPPIHFPSQSLIHIPLTPIHS